MSAPRIPAIGPILPARPAGAYAHEGKHPMARAPALGETLRLVLNAEDGTWSATGQEGKPVRLAASLLDHDGLADGLSPGDVLTVKVLATTPKLELVRVSSTATSWSAEPEHDQPFLGKGGPPPAMRPDQAAISRMSWAPPDAEALAMHWQVSVLAQVRKALGGRATDANWPNQPASWPASLPQSAQPPLERWLFPAHAWAGLPLALHLLPPGRRPSKHYKAAGRRPGWGLRVAGLLPGIGQVELQTQMVADGVELTILAEDDAVLRWLHEASALLADAVTRAGQRLTACRWMNQWPAEEAEEAGQGFALAVPLAPATEPMPAWPPGSLFRAGAEVLVAMGSIGAAVQMSTAAGTGDHPGHAGMPWPR